jgi:D-arabinose 1-dehydrogenase-like Zn-dependent alcohol dehydrogenase
MGGFKAIVVEKGEGGQTVGLKEFDESGLMDGDVTVRVTHSTVNYKDGLALTGKAPVVRRFPMIPGIDFAGTAAAPALGRIDRVQTPPGRLAFVPIEAAGARHYNSLASPNATARLARASQRDVDDVRRRAPT